MTAYYTVCFLVVSGPLATLGELGEESLHQPLPPVEEVMTSEVTAVSLRKRSVANRWTLRARVLERYCQEADVRVHRSVLRPSAATVGLWTLRLPLAECIPGGPKKNVPNFVSLFLRTDFR